MIPMVKDAMLAAIILHVLILPEMNLLPSPGGSFLGG
jgi:hypothetical protein